MKRKRLFRTTTAVLFVLFLTVMSVSAQMYVDGKYLKSPKQEDPIILRGVNRMVGWHDYGQERYDYIFSEIAKSGANSVRIQWTHENWRTTSELEQILNTCKKYKLIPMVAPFEATGKPLRDHYQKLIDYWTSDEMVNLINRHEDYFLLNVANEALGGESDFAYYYSKIARAIREAGIKVPLVLDCFREGYAPIRHGNELLAVDSNLIFSVHIYWGTQYDDSEGIPFGDPNYLDNHFSIVNNAGHCWIIGEFAGISWGCLTEHEMDHMKVMELCEQYDYGYLPWSWDNNNNGCSTIDMVGDDLSYASTYDEERAQWVKNVLRDSPHSIQNTSVIYHNLFNPPGCDINVDVIRYTAEVGKDSLSVNYQVYNNDSTTIEINNNDDWIHALLTDSTLVIDIDSNATYLSRQAKIILSGCEQKEIIISQNMNIPQGSKLIFNDNDPEVLYFETGWGHTISYGNGLYRNDQHYTTEAGQVSASVSLTFKGTQWQIFSTTDTVYGSATVALDNNEIVDTINLFSAERNAQALVWTSPVLERDTHTVTLTALMGNINLDKIITYDSTGISYYKLIIMADSGGVVTPGGWYEKDNIVTLEATPDAGYFFSGWSGSVNDTINPLVLTINRNLTIKANFEEPVTSVVNTLDNSGIEIYPNPVNDNYIYLRINEEHAGINSVNMFNLQGQLVYSHKINGQGSYQLNIGNLNAGLYTVRIGNKSEKLLIR